MSKAYSNLRTALNGLYSQQLPNNAHVDEAMRLSILPKDTNKHVGTSGARTHGLAHRATDHAYRVSKNVLYPKMQFFKNFYYNKDNRIWYFDLFKW